MEVYHLQDKTLYKISCGESFTEYYFNAHLFKNMIRNQSDGYWVKFCTTLKDVLEKEGYGIRYANHFEDFFIDLVYKLTSRFEEVKEIVDEVLKIARYSHFFRGAGVIEKYNVKEDNNGFAASLCKLFGYPSPDRFIKIWATVPLYLRFTGSLLTVFLFWLAGRKLDENSWEVPQSWRSSDGRKPGKYESYLKEKWGGKLFLILNTKKENIFWWDLSSKSDALGVSEKQSKLGCAIMRIVRDSEERQSFIMDSVLRDGLETLCLYCQIYNLPLGANVMFSCKQFETLFSIACCRELYLSNSMEAFHPRAQFLIEFWNKSFGSHFWKPLKIGGKEGCGAKEIKTVAFAWALGCQIRTAIYLDSRFYDKSSSKTTWSSPDVIVRLPWNMPLCLNWLQKLLLKIYKFEYMFLPFIHFPMAKQVKQLAEDIYINHCKRARFLVRAAIIVAEYIYMNEEDNPGSCYSARLTLKLALSLCDRILKFLSGPVYQIVEVIIRESYTEQERRQNKSKHYKKDLVDLKLNSACFVPNVDDAFSYDRRSINYWLQWTETVPNLEESLSCFPVVQKKLQEYEHHGKQHNYDCSKDKCENLSEPLYPYDRKMYFDTYTGAFGLKLSSCTFEDDVSFLKDFLELLEEEKLLHKVDIEEFYSILSHTDMYNSTTGEERQLIQEAAHLGRVYVVCAALVGGTYSDRIKIADQILFTKLINAECMSTMADVVSRFITTVIRFRKSDSKLCPPYKFFRRAEDVISSFGYQMLSVSQAVNLMSCVNHYSSYTSGYSLPSLKVPTPHDKTRPRDVKEYEDFVSDLQRVRDYLLYEISQLQLHNCQLASVEEKQWDTVMFPYYDVLEYRFVEEISALKRCVKMRGEYFKPYDQNLASLLYCRANWLIQEFENWKKGISATSRSQEFVCDTVAAVMVQVTAVLIPLHSVFTAYLTRFTLLHPVFETTVDFITETLNYYLKSLKERNMNENCFAGYYKTMTHMGVDYMNKLLDDAITTWAVPKITADSQVDAYVVYASAYDILFHSAMLCAYHALSSAHGNVSLAIEFLNSISDALKLVEVFLRSSLSPCAVDYDGPSTSVAHIYDVVLKDISSQKMFVLKEETDKNNLHWRGYSSTCFSSCVSLIKNPTVIHLKSLGEKMNKTAERKAVKQVTLRGKVLKEVKKQNSQEKIQGTENIASKTGTGTESSSLRGLDDCMKNCSVTGENGVQPEAAAEKRESINVGIKKTSKPNLKSCSLCGIQEPEKRTFKKCSLCAKENWKVKRFYCSTQCQANDWKDRHCQDHKNYRAASVEH